MRYAHAVSRWKKVGNARKMFQNNFGNNPWVFQKTFWNFARSLPEKNWN
jgi:hypothetical protein